MQQFPHNMYNSSRHLWQKFIAYRHTRNFIVGLSLILIAVLWWLLAVLKSPGALFGLYSNRVFVFLLAVTYLSAGVLYIALSRQKLKIKLTNFILSTSSFLLLFGLLELPALLGLLDYRLLIGPPQSTLFTTIKPWENPKNQLDPELLHIHRPNQRIVGETVGDLVYWLGISDAQPYQMDVQYDGNGFRNDHEIKQAPVVIIGDSFVEAGLVPYQSLLSTHLGQMLEAEVANLGQSGYSPQQELIVLMRYAIQLQPDVIFWLFFEGNDLLDVPRYESVVQDWEKTMAEYHGFKARSFSKNALKALAGLTTPRLEVDAAEAIKRSCALSTSTSTSHQNLHFAYAGTPLSDEDLASLEKVQKILLEAKEFSHQNGAELVFVFVPTKFRVYQDLCEFPEDSYGRQWIVNDLPSRLEAWTAEQDIPYVDLTVSLHEAAASGELVFFPDDGHWNAKGNEVAAQQLADFLSVRGWLGN